MLIILDSFPLSVRVADKDDPRCSGAQPCEIHPSGPYFKMAPQPAPSEQGIGTHQPQPPNIPPVAADDPTASPSTPVRSILETPRRSNRKSEQTFDYQTLPGTRWDELEIERQRERQRGRETASDISGTRSLNRLSLRERSVQVSSHRPGNPKDSDPRPAQRQTKRSGYQPASNTLGPLEENPSQVPATGSSSTKKGRPKQPVRVKHRLQLEPRRESASETGLTNQSSSLIADSSIEADLQSSMARRPGRNQVDYVAELKETIHESLSKLSDIQEKLGPLGQQILTLEEELKAKESDSSKPEETLWIPRLLP
jgi:hypothetical protein